MVSAPLRVTREVRGLRLVVSVQSNGDCDVLLDASTARELAGALVRAADARDV
jgi:hypothetical protein